jgi:lipoprotein-releasing system permease protein
MNRLELRIASRYLKGRRPSGLVSLITFIATGGVVVGVMALIVVMGVMNGLQTELRNRILVASPHLQIFTYGEGLRIDDWRPALETVRNHPEVVAAAPVIITTGLISAGADFSEGVMVLGIDPDTGTAAVTELAQHFVRGDLEFAAAAPEADGGIVLGQRVASRLTVYPGDVVKVISPVGSRYSRAIGAIVPRVHQYEVTGSFDTGMYEYDNNYAILPLEAAQRFAGLDSAVSGIQVRIEDPWRAPDVGRELEGELGYPYRYLDWQTQNSGLFSALKLEKLAMGLILLLIVVVAA